MISTGANLYHDLHYALNFTLHRGSPFLDDVELYEQGIIRIYDVLFPATVLLETDAYIRDFLVRSKLDGPISTSEFHYRLGLDLLERNPACASTRSSPRRPQCGVPIYTSSPGDSSIGMNIAYHELMNGGTLMIDPNKDVNEVCAIILAGQQNGCVILGGGSPEELLPAGAADALGGLRHPQGGQRLLHPDHDRPGRLGRAVGRDAGRGGQLGQGQSRACCPTPSSRTAIRRSPFRCSASTPSAPSTTAVRASELVHKRDALVADLLRQAKRGARLEGAETDRRSEPARDRRHR